MISTHTAHTSNMAEAALVEEVHGPSQGTLVSVSFEKNEKTKFKFLEGEPKALGLTQMGLGIFHISSIATLFATGLIRTGLEIPSIISSLLIIIAGSLAIAAKRLHLPTLRACLGMEVVAGIASIFNLIVTLVKMSEAWRFSYYCYYRFDNDQDRQNCRNIKEAHTHFFAELVVIQVAQFAISITLMVYAAKVAKCCTSTPKVPVITIQAPPAPQ